jgi:hypothetical protein
VWHPETGAHEVHGAILDHYLEPELGGTVFGYPTTDETATADGSGRFNHFYDPASGSDKSIYWTDTTKAHAVIGLIRGRWVELGSERSPLGYPTADETDTVPPGGRYQTFDGGTIVWHPDLGAFETVGAINARYGELGGSGWGYPTTGEGHAKAPGLFNHFVHLPSGQERSIYFTPDTGAVEVYGAIHTHWKNMKWESSHLGFPTSPEADWPEGGFGSRQQQFEGGRILYRARDGATAADPMKWLHELPKKAISGFVEATAHHDGSVEFHAYIKGSSWEPQHYRIQALLKAANNMALTFTRDASVSSTHVGDDRNHHNQADRYPLVRVNYFEFANGSLHVKEDHGGKITGALGDALEGLLKFAVGSVVFSDLGTSLIILGGIELAAIIGDSALGGMRFIGGNLFLAGPNGTVFALAAEAILALATKERELRPDEWVLADAVFKGSVPRDRIRITDAKGWGNSMFTFPRADGKVVLSAGDYYDDLLGVWADDTIFPAGGAPGTWQPLAPGQAFIHELVHAWQYLNNDAAISYVGDAIWAKFRHAIHPGRGPGDLPAPQPDQLPPGEVGYHLPEEYDPGVELDEDWDSFGLEEQAVIVSRWFARHYNGPNSPVDGHGDPVPTTNDYGLLAPAAVEDDAFKYIEGRIRTGKN